MNPSHCRSWYCVPKTPIRACPPKLVIMTPWRALCVDLIGPYTLIGKDNSRIDFICLTMINPATSWFKIVELPIVTKLTVPTKGKGEKEICDDCTKESEMTFTSHLHKSVT
jgi:hypothetical protein